MKAIALAAQARSAYAERRWADACAAFIQAGQERALDGDDLEALACCAALVGRDDVLIEARERLYAEHSKGGRGAAAGHAAFWLGFRLLASGEIARAGGWFALAQRAVDAVETECATRGWLLLPQVQRQLRMGDSSAARDNAALAAAIGERCGDGDLVAFARNLQGRALLRLGELDAGLALIDEVMVEVSSGRLTPLVTGLVYCSVIASCHQVYALDRAREWTTALSAWCDAQSQLVTFTGSCLVHRAEILELEGAWQAAADEAKRASQRAAKTDPQAAGDAHYQRAEIHRLRGEAEAAEQAYREASRFGREPQPGLALLRLAQGQADAALAALRQVLTVTSAPLSRARFLSAAIEVALTAGELATAREWSSELSRIAARFGTEVLQAMAAGGQGAVALADDEAQAAVPVLLDAFRSWQRIGAPYLAARVRVLIGRARGALGDDDGQRLELDAARSVFEELGATSELAALASVKADGVRVSAHGLTTRELEVLRLVASGLTNKAVGARLHISERTVDRHVSNILTKLRLPSRSAATGFAYEQKLI